MSDEENTPQAPGIAAAWAQPEETEGAPRRRRGVGPDPMEKLRNWTPKTRLGRMVQSGQIITIDDAFATGMPIREVEIVDALLPGLEDDIINVNMIQRMTDSGRRVRFNVMACVGNKDGYVGLSICKGKEVAATIQKAITNAKLNIIQIQRGNGSWESGRGAGTSVPFKVTGRAGSTRITLIPAPTGKGLVIGDTGRQVLTLAGVTDVWSRSKGQTRTTINFAKATFNALKQLNAHRVTKRDHETLNIVKGRVTE
ncbi:MAG: 30S ribosomal protein S5 [Candidatus Thalassarchaeaceae archaeon]|nr:30S ribosomal protein S5 [Candidatus Thalassarchaeaceae archaeon]